MFGSQENLLDAVMQVSSHLGFGYQDQRSMSVEVWEHYLKRTIETIEKLERLNKK